MSSPPPGLAALFGKRPPAADPSPAPAPKPLAEFFKNLEGWKATAPAPASAADAPPAAPFAVPSIFRDAKAPTSTIDVRAAAALALGPAYFDAPDPLRPDAPAPRPFAAFSETATEGLPPAGLFKGISKAGPKPKAPRVVKAGATSLATLFKLAEEPVFRKGTKVADAQRRAGVSDSPELKRIVHIERRPPPALAAETPDLTEEFARRDSNGMITGAQRLWKVQSAALAEARSQGGLLAPVNVGGGKCVCGHTEVLDTTSGRRRRADELGEFNVATADLKTGQIVSAPTRAFRSGVKECSRMVLANGMELEASDDHPVLTPTGYTSLRSLKVGDLVATARSLPPSDRTLPLTDAEIAFISYMMADGECGTGMTFTNARERIIHDFRNAVAALGGKCRFKTKNSEAETWVVKSRPLRKLLKDLDLRTLSRCKRVPAHFVGGLSPRQIALFLNRFIACDGSLTPDTCKIEIMLASEDLIKDLRWLLLRLGVSCRTHFRMMSNSTSPSLFQAWRLVVKGEDAVRLLNATGPIIGKEDESITLVSLASSKKHNTNVDIVPVGYEEFNTILDELDFPKRGSATPGSRPRTDARLFVHSTQGQNLSRAKFIEFCKRYNYKGRYAWLAAEHICWEKVERLKPIGRRAVYDLTVPGTENFVANGLIIHNTLMSLLVGEAMKAKRIVLLVKPSLRSKLIDSDIPKLSRHWKLPLASMRILSYHQLSNAKTANILDEVKPDLIVADEAHELRHRSAARTKRFLRYMKDHPECSFVGMSGTFTRRSLHDYQHLAELALRKNSPLPGNYGTLSEWAEALDVSDDPMAPGALVALCSDEESAELDRTVEAVAAQKVVRSAFRRRLIETPGVVATDETEVDASLTIEAHRPSVPGEVKAQLLDVRHHWEIDGEELVDPLTVARVLRQLAAGFRYKWKWPNDQPDNEWLDARREWFREVREILKLSRKGMDSPLLISSACERGDFASDNYEAWRKVKERYKPQPPSETVWTSDFLIKDALAWANDPANKPGIIWYTWRAIGEKLAEVSGLPFFGPGAKASADLVTLSTSPALVKKSPIIIASIMAHGTGKDLQPYTHHLVTTPPSGGVEWEQLLGRSHRPGQESDEVAFKVCVHTVETENAFRNAVRDAGYIEQTTGQKQKLNYADRVGFDAKAFDFDSGKTDVQTEGLAWTGQDLETLLRNSLKKT